MRIIGHQKVTPLQLAAAVKVWQIDDPSGTPVFVDVTTAFNNAATGDVLPWPASEAIGDRQAIGYSRKFRRVRFIYSTAGIGGTVKYKYWNGTTYVEVANPVDASNGFTEAAGTYELTFDMPTDWVAQTLNGETTASFYLYVEVLTVYATNPIFSRGFIVRGAPLVIPAVVDSAYVGSMLRVRALNPDSTACYFTKAGQDDLSSELVPGSAASRYESVDLDWGATYASPPELYSTETAPDAVHVTLFSSP